jgi:hypothetical protein
MQMAARQFLFASKFAASVHSCTFAMAASFRKAARSNLIAARLPKGGMVSEAIPMRIILAIVFAVAGAVCWLLPGEIDGLLPHVLPVSPRQSAIIGSLFFAAAALLWFIRPSKGPR